MRGRGSLLAFALALSGCAGRGSDASSPGDAAAPDASVGEDEASFLVPDAAGITELVGEMHLHELPGGSHAFADFVAGGVPVSAASQDTITEVDTAVTEAEGPCALSLVPTCTPGCTGTSFCYAPDSCQPFPSWQYIDGGQIVVTGSSVIPEIRMWWDPSASTYDADPAPGAPSLFAGGDMLHIVGGMGPSAFVEDVVAPQPIALLAPDPNADFHMMPGALDVRWTSEGSDDIEILVTSQAASGALGSIRCVTTDTGSLTVPADMMNAMPPPPRQTSFEILRNDTRVVPVAQKGEGVYVHVGQTTWLDGLD
jgi:hypothetical protein